MRLGATLGVRDWRDRLVTPEEAVEAVPAGARVYVGSGCGVPGRLVAALEDAAVAHPGVELVHYLNAGVAAVGETSTLRHRAFFLGARLADQIPTGRVDYVPMSLEEVPRLIRSGRLRIDVALVQVTPPDAEGLCSLGISVDAGLAAIEAADLVIAEVTDVMPHTGRHSLVPIGALDVIVEGGPELCEYRPPEVGEVADGIARYVARLIDDGSTIQAPIGRLSAAVVSRLTQHFDLGVHTDVLTDAISALVEAGVVTGRRKSMSRGRVVAATVMGTQRLYDLVDGDPRFVLRPIDEVCDPDALAGQSRMVSITQAYAVDLTGQVCAEATEGRPYAGVGTQVAFHRGAVRSPGGRAMVCLSARAADGQSAVVARLAAHQAVTIPRWDLHWVVTEYGTAYLFGASLRERAVALIEIAHPDDRQALLAQARDLGLVPSDQKQRSRRAYPVEEERRVELHTGQTVLVRPTRTSDAPLLQELFFRLRAQDVVTRFFRRLSSLTRQMAEHLCSVGYEGEMAFAAVVGQAEQQRVVGTSSYFVDPATGDADVAYMVDPEWQGMGLGSALHGVTSDYARRHGVRAFTADVLADNDPMLAIFRSSPGRLSTTERDGSVEIHLDLTPEPAPADDAAADPTAGAGGPAGDLGGR